MSVYAQAVTVATTTVGLVNTGGGSLLTNDGPEVAYLGSDTTTADESSTGGWKLHPGQTVSLTSDAGLYAVTSTGTAVLRSLYSGVALVE